MAHTASFVIQVLCAIAAIIGTYIWFAEANVVGILDLHADDSRNTLAILAMSPLFFCLNATSFIPHKWRDVFRVIAAFFFLNHFELAVCDTKVAFDKLTANETIDKTLHVTPDAVRLTWAALLFIVISASLSFIVDFLLEPILVAAFGPANNNSTGGSKKRVKRKRTNNDVVVVSDTASNAGSEMNNTKTVTITIGAPLKIAYIGAALLVVAGTAILISTGDACTYFDSPNAATQRQLSQTFPAIAFLLLTGSALNDARALDIAVSMLMMNVLNWQPTDYNIHDETEHKLLATSALLQTAGDIVIVFVFMYGILEARRHKTNYVANLRSFNFKLTSLCWIFGFIGAALVLNHPNVENSQIWIASFSGFVVPIFGIGSAVFSAEACFVPSAFVGLRATSLIAASLQGTNGPIRYGWLLLILSNFGGCMSAIKMITDPHFVSEEEGTYESVPTSPTTTAAAASSSPEATKNNNTKNKKQQQQQQKHRNAEELIEWIRGDNRVFTAFLLALVSALAIRSPIGAIYNIFLRAMYLGILVLVSLGGRDAAGTIVMLAGASYVTTKELWFIDNDPSLLFMTAFIFAAALWMFLLFNRDSFPYLPMHHAFAREVVDYSLARTSSLRANNEEQSLLAGGGQKQKEQQQRQSNVADGYGATG